MLESSSIGFIAAVSTTLSFVPQVLQSYRSRDVSGISLGMYSFFTFGVGLWLVYGLMTRAWPVIIANALTLVLALSILALKLASLRKANSGPSMTAINAPSTAT
jgi:MtN3 and saliva related transmembrane protein